MRKRYRYTKFFIKTFIDKELALYAASLSFYTIFTIIPLLLIIMTMLTSLPSFDKYYMKIKSYILSNFMPINSQSVLTQIDNFLQNADKIGYIGFISIVIASLFFFQNFEYIANKIFHAKNRNFFHSVLTYLTLVTLTPLGLGISLYVSAKLANMISKNIYNGIDLLPLIPYLITWILFYIIFQVSANIKINAKASLYSSLITAIVFSLAKNLFIFYIILNKSYSTIYGSFAILMFLFLWIYFSWIIFIYGLKLCYIFNEVYKKKKQF
jgi:membrane protein